VQSCLFVNKYINGYGFRPVNRNIILGQADWIVLSR